MNSQQPPPTALFDQLADWFRALGEPARLHLLWRLKAGECAVGELVTATGLAQASVSKHLATLRQAGLVAVRRTGQQAIYRIADPVLLEICTLACGSMAARQAEQARSLTAPAFAPAPTTRITPVKIRKSGR